MAAEVQDAVGELGPTTLTALGIAVSAWLELQRSLQLERLDAVFRSGKQDG